MNSGVPRKDLNLGQLFDSPTKDSPYKDKAKDKGIYINGSGDCQIDLNNNTLLLLVTEKKYFYNWRTNKEINLLEINLGNLKQVLQADYPNWNGIIYAEYPILLRNAANLPGENSAGKTAVFTVISEESIYLKNNYNTTAWKISHLVTKKMVYGLSGNFAHPEVKAPDFFVYHRAPYGSANGWDEYPFVYMQKNADGTFTDNGSGGGVEGDPALNNGGWVNTDYANGNDLAAKYPPGIMSPSQGNWAIQQRKNKQAAWNGPAVPPNRVYAAPGYVGALSFQYNSLFITAFTIADDSVPRDYSPGDWTKCVLNTHLEDWEYYNLLNLQYEEATINIKGAFIYLYDPDDPDFDDEYYTPLGAEENTFDYRRPDPYNGPSNGSYLRNGGWRDNAARDDPIVNQDYDDRFPQAVPKNPEAVLGLTGESVFRQVSQDFFCAQTGGCSS